MEANVPVKINASVPKATKEISVQSVSAQSTQPFPKKAFAADLGFCNVWAKQWVSISVPLWKTLQQKETLGLDINCRCLIAAVCEPGCGSYGICIEPNTCQCREGWHGRHCNKSKWHWQNMTLRLHKICNLCGVGLLTAFPHQSHHTGLLLGTV